MQRFRIVSEPLARPEDIHTVRNGVHQHNLTVTKDENYSPYSPVTIFLKDDDDAVLGGVLGDIWGGWLHITFLWLAEPLRRQGYGRRLLQAAEAQARAKGCRGVFLETFSFQARPFYERYGYKVFAELPDYPESHTLYFMKKEL